MRAHGLEPTLRGRVRWVSRCRGSWEQGWRGNSPVASPVWSANAREPQASISSAIGRSPGDLGGQSSCLSATSVAEDRQSRGGCCDDPSTDVQDQRAVLADMAGYPPIPGRGSPRPRSTSSAGASRATRWPEKETVADPTQGVPLATMQELVRYWGSDYDFRRFEARLNAVPQFLTEIDGLDIHFIHVRSRARERPAGHHHARLAGLDHRDAERHRPAHRPDRPRRRRRGRVRRRHPVDARLRLLGQADRRPAGIPSTSRTPGSR